jgi:hypothetical protein
MPRILCALSSYVRRGLEMGSLTTIHKQNTFVVLILIGTTQKRNKKQIRKRRRRRIMDGLHDGVMYLRCPPSSNGKVIFPLRTPRTAILWHFSGIIKHWMITIWLVADPSSQTHHTK